MPTRHWIQPLRFLTLIAMVSLACGRLTAPEPTKGPLSTPTGEAAGQALSLTIYNQGSALVRDERTFTLTNGRNDIAFSDVAATMDPTSVLFKPVEYPDQIVTLEQNFQYDLVATTALLQKYLDQTVSVVTQDGHQYRGRLLSGKGDIILQDASGQVNVVKLDQVQQFSFPSLPDGLITRPTLAWLLDSQRSGPENFELTYLTSGVGWQSDYVVLLAPDEKSIDLDGWVTLNNSSGTTFSDAHIKLVAGDLQRLQQQGMSAPQAALAAEDMATKATVDQRQFFEYHLYDIPRPVTVKNNETKQVQFVTARHVPAAKFFVYDGQGCRSNPWYCQYQGYLQTDPSYGVSSNPKVMVMVEFDTKDVNADLPKGRVRLYKQDIDGAALLIGEDSIDHTPKGEHIQLYVGDAFDIVGERVQTDFHRPDDHSLDESYKITLRNHKSEAVEVRVVEHLFRWSDWRILRASTDYTKIDSSTIEFRVQIPADGEQTVSYTAHYFWP